MKIEQNQIASVEPFGVLNGKPVNIARLRGGLNLATTTDDKGDETVLAAASHQAILAFTLEQRFSGYQPMLMKSEGLTVPKAESHSHFLTDNLRKSGYDIYSVQNNNNIDFYITRQNVKVGLAKAVFENDSLSIKNIDIPGEFADGISGAFSEKALSSGFKKVRFE